MVFEISMVSMDLIISNSPEDTLAIGRKWGEAAQAGWVFGLSGDLGAGKTQLVKGIAQGLGISDRVSSPSYGLLNEIGDGRLPLWHLDLYRLNSWDEIVDAGLDEYLGNARGVVVIEWVERWMDRAPADRAVHPDTSLFRRVRMGILSETQRQIEFEDLSN